MKASPIRIALIATMLVFATADTANAAGCLKGAMIGGVAGHYAGHHAVVGAVGGCVVGRHLAKQACSTASRATSAGSTGAIERRRPDVPGRTRKSLVHRVSDNYD